MLHLHELAFSIFLEKKTDNKTIDLDVIRFWIKSFEEYDYTKLPEDERKEAKVYFKAKIEAYQDVISLAQRQFDIKGARKK